MYTYYKEVQKEEHLLFAEEIQTICFLQGKSVSISEIHGFYRAYAKKHDEYEQLYYKTKAGLKKVYPCKLFLNSL